MAKAIASGDQRLMQKAGLEAEIARLVRLHDAHIDNQIAVRRTITDARETIAFNQRRIGEITQDLAVRQDTRGDNFALRLNGQRFNERKAAGSAILKAVLEAAWDEAAKVTGEIGGFPFSVRVTRDRKAAIMASHIVIQRDHFRDKG